MMEKMTQLTKQPEQINILFLLTQTKIKNDFQKYQLGRVYFIARWEQNRKDNTKANLST